MAFVRMLSHRRSSSNDTVHKNKKQTVHAEDKRAHGTSQTDGPWSPEIDREKGNGVQRRCKHDHNEWSMPADKELETAVLRKQYVYIVENLPPEDVAPLMYNRQLLTQRENDEFQSMKRTHCPPSDKSEHLWNCLLRRQKGSLKLFCELLKEIPPAQHIADVLKEDYKNSYIKRGRQSTLKIDTFSPENRDRLSKISLSDPDIRIKDVAQHCTQCKVLGRQNKKLDRHCRKLKTQLEELDKELNRLQENRLKVEAYVEMAKEQFESSKDENKRLTELASKLQSEISHLDSRNKMAGSSLMKLEQLLRDDKKPLEYGSTPTIKQQLLTSKIMRDHRLSRSFSDSGETTEDESIGSTSDLNLPPLTSRVRSSHAQAKPGYSGRVTPTSDLPKSSLVSVSYEHTSIKQETAQLPSQDSAELSESNVTENHDHLLSKNSLLHPNTRIKDVQQPAITRTTTSIDPERRFSPATFTTQPATTPLDGNSMSTHQCYEETDKLDRGQQRLGQSLFKENSELLSILNRRRQKIDQQSRT